MTKRIHFTERYLMSPSHPVSVNVIGAGGTGSQMMTCLSRLDVTLRALGHPGLFVRLYDPDMVSETNIGRQLFAESEVGLNKAACLISRINNFFGNDWAAEQRRYPSNVKDARQNDMANIFITCTDNTESRLTLWEILKQLRKMSHYDMQNPLYWLDIGNGQTFGQVLLGTVQDIRQPKSKKFQTVSALPVITEYVNYKQVKNEDSGPSCSLAEALEKQDLFINSTLAQFGCNILWKMFRHGSIEHRGIYLNLDTMKVNPIAV